MTEEPQETVETKEEEKVEEMPQMNISEHMEKEQGLSGQIFTTSC